MFIRPTFLRAPDGATGDTTADTTTTTTAPALAAFAEQLPEDIRGEAAFRDIKDLGSLAKGYLHAQRMIGRDPSTVLALPGADDAEGWNGVFAKLGRPESPDKYALPEVKLPDGVAIDEGLKKGFLDKAHAAGLSDKQAGALYAWYNQQTSAMVTGQQQARTQAAEQGVAALKAEWGQAFDTKVALANKALEHYGDSALDQALKSAGLLANPAMMKFLSGLGAGMAEDGLIGRGEPGGNALSPAEAKQEINALRADKTFLADYTNARAPGHQAAVAKMQRLYEFAHPAAAG
jgi:hypothetical protein